jgi:predicted 2-oxoglutarate/Fe(II)-dependent dioxygenase YbiX
VRISPGIFTLPNFLTPDECEAIIALTEHVGYEPAPITTAGGFKLRPDIRNNTRVMIDDIERASALWTRVREHVPIFIRGRQAIALNERFRFYRYDPGERFAPHRDGAFRRDNGECSLLTFMIYLNEGFSGGDTVFADVTVTPQRGMALIFEHDLLHEGAPVTSGRKYVLRSDVMYGPVGQIRG